MFKYLYSIGLSFSFLFLFSLRHSMVENYIIQGKVSCNSELCKETVPVKMIYTNYVSKEKTEKTLSTKLSDGSFSFTYQGYRGDNIEIIANYNKKVSGDSGKCTNSSRKIKIQPIVETYWMFFTKYKNTVILDKNPFNIDCFIKP